MRSALARRSASSALESVRERADDGSVVVEVPCANPLAFRSWVLGFLEHAEVVSPPEQRDAILDWLRSIAGRG